MVILLKATKLGRLDKNKTLVTFQQMLDDGFWLVPTTAVEFERILSGL